MMHVLSIAASQNKLPTKHEAVLRPCSHPSLQQQRVGVERVVVVEAPVYLFRHGLRKSNL